MNENRVYIGSCKMVLWPIRLRVLFELFYNIDCQATRIIGREERS